jgi:Pin2-interacting protein X1
MLKNMGWEEGRGLGAKQEGTTTHITIKKKVSNAGIGEANSSSDNWLQGAFDYSNLLKRLNGNKAETGWFHSLYRL